MTDEYTGTHSVNRRVPDKELNTHFLLLSIRGCRECRDCRIITVKVNTFSVGINNFIEVTRTVSSFCFGIGLKKWNKLKCKVQVRTHLGKIRNTRKG